MADPTPPKRPSWRGGASARPRDAKRSSWQEAPRTAAPGYARSNFWRRVRLFALSALAVGMIGFVIWKLLPGPSKVNLVTLAAAEGYDFPLPPNAWVREDLARLGQLTSTYRITDRSARAREIDSAEQWTAAALARRLSEPLTNDRGSRQTAILYLSAHGAVRQRAGRPEPCLIPPGLTPEQLLDDEHWVSVAQLVEQLAKEPTLANRLTLVVLDVGKLGEPWPLGIFDASFPSALAAAGDGLSQPAGGRLWLLTSVDDEQTAWASAALGGSAFGHYFGLALSGEADREGDGDQRITAEELRAYLAQHVDAWAAANRAARQTPRWITPKTDRAGLADAVLVEVDAAAPLPKSVAGAVDTATLHSLDDLWRESQPWQGQAAAQAPASWQDLIRRLLWTEQWAAAGPASADRAKQAALDCRTRWEVLHNLLNPPAAAPSSLAAWHRLDSSETATAAWRRWEQLTSEGPTTSGANLRQDLTTLLSETRPPRPAAELAFVSQLLRQLDVASWTHHDLVHQALASVGARERLAAEFPSDEDRGLVANDARVAAWIAKPLAEHDQTMRSALDQLMVGANASRDEAAAGLNKASEQFTAARQRGLQIAEAYALCDQIWAEAPYSAKWQASRRPPDTTWETNLRELSKRTATLATLLYDRGPGSAPMDEIVAVTTALQPAWEAFRQPLTEETETLLPQAAAAASQSRVQPEQWRRLQALLAVPQLSAESRPALRNEWLDLDQRLQTAFERTPQRAASEPANALSPAEPPAIVLWRLSESAPAASAVAAGGEFRQTLLSLVAGNRGWSSVVAEHQTALRGGGDLMTAADSDRPSSAEREARLLSPAVPTPGANNDAVRYPMSLRSAARACGEATRRMDDFWGPLGEEPAPYFADAAAEQLQESRARLSKAPVQLGDAEIERLLPAVRLADLRRYAESPLVNLESSRLEESFGATTSIELDLRPRLETSLGVRGDVALRVVVAAGDEAEPLPVWIDGQSDRGDFGRAYPLTEAVSQTLAVSTNGLTGRGEPQASAWFRGFLTKQPLGTPSASKRVITVRYPEPGPALVRVDGRLKKRAQVMFVLDCSRSMNTDLKDGGSRLAAAWKALTTVAGDLAERQQYDVGLRMYAHRYDFGRDQNDPNKYNTREVVQGNLPNRPRVQNPQAQQPATDSETVLPMRRFNRGDARLLDALQPQQGVGVTPLYYSILAALKNDFLDRDEPKFLVVLTDGADQVYALGSGERSASADLPDVARELEKSKAQLHVVGFDLQSGDLASWNTFRRWVEYHAGQTYDASDPEQLSAALNKALGLNEFTVRDVENSTVQFTRRLGEAVTIPREQCRSDRNWSASTASNARELSSEPFQVEGGEYLRLEIDESDERIVFRRYDERQDDKEVGPTPETDGWRMGSWRDLPRIDPRVQPNLATFFTWAQREDPLTGLAVFSPRPDIVWVEITPYSNDHREPRGDRYVFYDAPFVPQVEVPMVETGAPNWPEGCEMAKVEMWLRIQAPTPALRMALRELPAEGALRLNVEGDNLSAVRVTAEIEHTSAGVGIVTINESWTNPPEGFRPLAIQVEPQPDEVRHSYGDGNRKAKHEFVYDHVEAGWLADKELSITPFDSIRQGAIATPEPLWVSAKAPR